MESCILVWTLKASCMNLRGHLHRFGAFPLVASSFPGFLPQFPTASDPKLRPVTIVFYLRSIFFAFHIVESAWWWNLYERGSHPVVFFFFPWLNTLSFMLAFCHLNSNIFKNILEKFHPEFIVVIGLWVSLIQVTYSFITRS